MKNKRKTGIMLLNMGGPEKLDDVEPFLLNLFSDRGIIRLGPRFLQKFIARRIARRRAPQSAANYQKIGSRSPINEITRAQARALEQALQNDGGYLVEVGMRYWHPRTPDTLQRLLAQGIDSLIALPLYPHYCAATSGSSLTDLREAVTRQAAGLTCLEIPSWPDNPMYIECLADRVREGMERFHGEPAELVYSAHSLPQKFIDEGDPYVRELQRTISALEQKTAIAGHLCYQSRSGPVQWLAPSTLETLQLLADQGSRNILLLPISFVSDHIETLYEVDILFREEAAKRGMRLESTRALNDDPQFIEALRSIVLEVKGDPGVS